MPSREPSAALDAKIRGERIALGKAINARRRDLGLTQTALAGISGVSQRKISQIESGVVDIRMSTARKLASGLTTSLENLLRKN
jgi:predicted transcriptional regulator